MSTTSTKQKVMLATLNISIWTARHFDKNGTAAVESKYQKLKVGRFNKALIPQNADAFLKIGRIATQIRTTFDAFTLDYQQLGVRLLTTSVYLDWTQKLRKMDFDFQNAVEDFLIQYPSIKEAAKAMLGPLYDESNYPHIDHLREKFGVKFSVLPFPDAEQFGVELPEADLLNIKEQLSNSINEAVEFARSDLSRRLYEATLHLAQRAASDGKFHSSAIENLREIIAILPKLNFTNDQRLTSLANQAHEELTLFDADDLRKKPSVRSEVADKAAAIATDMAEYMGIEMDPFLFMDDEPSFRSGQMDLLAA